ncbi:MAG: MFS transporter [Nitrososphaerales archaeon]
MNADTNNAISSSQPNNVRYLVETSAVYIAVFLMRFSFAFTVVAIQWIVPVQIDRGIISSAYPAMEMATAFFFGILADRIGRKWIIVVALLASSVITLSFTFTTNFFYLTIIHGLQGICAVAIITSTLALLADFARIKTRGREMGVYDFSTIGGYGIGFGFALVLIGGNPSKALEPFYAGAVVAVIGAIISAVILKEGKARKSEKFSLRANIQKITSSKSVVSLIPVWFVLMMLIGVALTFTRELSSVLLPGAAQFLLSGQRTFHPGFGMRIGILEIILIFLGSVLLGFTQSSFGSLSDRFGRSRIILIGEFSMLGLLLTLLFVLSFNINRFALLPMALIFGVGVLAFTPAALAELADMAPSTGRGSTMGLYSLTVGAGTVFGPIAGGVLISDFGIVMGLSILFGIGALILILALVLRITVFSQST